MLLVSATTRNRSQPFAAVRARPSLQKSGRVYGESHQNVSLDVSEDVLMSFCFHAWHFVTFDVFHYVSAGMCVCVRDRREGRVAVSMGKATKNVSFSRCQKMCSPFCVAGVALCGIRGV